MKKEYFIVSALMGTFILLGIGIGTYFHSTPEAVSAAGIDRNEGVIMATGTVFVQLGSIRENANINYSSLDAVYTLDQNTGQLMVGILAREGQGFQGLFSADINQGLASVMQTAGDTMAFPQRPRFSMVTGEVTIPSSAGAKWQVPQGVVYIHELTTGYVMVYTIPWTGEYRGGGAKMDEMKLWTAQRFTAPYVGM